MRKHTELLVDARVVAGGAVIDNGWVAVQDGSIIEVGSDHGRPVPHGGTSLGGNIVLPGFVDPHVHGGGGWSFSSNGDGLGHAARFHAIHGTTSLLAGLVTCAPERMLGDVRRVAKAPEDSMGPDGS